MLKNLVALMILLPFWTVGEETAFTLAEGVSGIYEVSPAGQVMVKVTQLEEGQTKKLSVSRSTGHLWHVIFSLVCGPVSGFGRHTKLEVAQEFGQTPTGNWYEYHVFEDKKCLGPPARCTVVLDLELLIKANRLAHQIGVFFLKAQDPQKIATPIFEALALPTEPVTGQLQPGQLQVSQKIVGTWSSHQTRDGVLEKLSFDDGKLSWTIHHSTWNRGPAMDLSGLTIQLTWKSNSKRALTVSKAKGKTTVDSTLSGAVKQEKGLIQLSETLLEHLRKNGSNQPLPLALREKIIQQMELSLESYLAD